jgi:prolyl-tRNA synthetase
MRGREFFMKDLYSFSRTKEEHDSFYDKMKDVYMKVFNRLGMGDRTYLTVSSGGSFSKYSYEFQTVSDAGEDIIYIDENKNIAVNSDDFNDEVIKDFDLEADRKNYREEKSIEVGDIYSLGYKYSESFDLKFKNEEGKDELVYMGSYGMSPSRLMGAVVELNSDERGMIWPEEIAPFKINLISINQDEMAEKIYKDLQTAGIEVLYDDRDKVSVGEKMADADLIGCPYRIVVGKKTLEQESVELKRRDSDEVEMVKIEDIVSKF